LTVTLLFSFENVKVTPFGIVIGCLPIRDMASQLIDVTQYFTTNIQITGFLVRDHTF
jgi:hypothetical protein